MTEGPQRETMGERRRSGYRKHGIYFKSVYHVKCLLILSSDLSIFFGESAGRYRECSPDSGTFGYLSSVPSCTAKDRERIFGRTICLEIEILNAVQAELT